MDKKTVTIKDIARMLGISKSTVSRALSGRSDIHPETKQKIMALASELHYEPNALAINLKQQKTNTIGVIIPETMNRFFAHAVGGIQKVSDMAGVNVMICQSNESYISEKNNLHSLVSSRVDGLIVSISRETDRTDHFKPIIDRGIPMVFFDRICQDIDASQVYTDNYEIAFEGTEHLILQGYRRIAFVAGPQHLFNSRNRLQGYVDALKKHNLPVRESYIVHSHYRSDKVEEYTRYLMQLPQRPDAVFAINDYAAIEMMHIMKKSGLKIPDDIAFLGFNNESMCRFVEPPLSSIDHPAHDMGAAAAEILITQIRHQNLKPENRIIKSKLVIRESTGAKQVL
ncbi:LacI family DNA-binding transcriptional regulator [Chryseolinea lacunae]|uniref:LacI family DNA-binding transcriptional regulator n=1 Tax=Chryseolinea lacunae TaxID=2801331 RepID=A0ABS1KYI5_9BACT|nr:LacI family DNA-binding transcriptional regulator [Chryseolinea lacunae]MBL0744510.1 LacI family DNA-binding transcriptional regulator [Chryseolinea lacunae]